MPWGGREGPHSRKTFVKGGFNSGDGRRAAMGAPYVTRACMGPIGVLANHPGRSATLSRRPVPPTREYHPRYLRLENSVGPATKGWKQPGLRCAPPGRPRPRPRPYTTAQAESPHSTHRTHNTHTARTLADAQFPFGTSPALQLMLSSNARGDGNLSTMQSPATKNQGFLRYTVRGYSFANLAELFAAAASRRTSPFS